ncbi:MAG TPA: hypothetical protein VFY56_15085 [Propionibacteriaceae bacterium]|nr:hypothetical protein [Propionibacteriaceae bacterium]
MVGADHFDGAPGLVEAMSTSHASEHGSPAAALAQRVTVRLPDTLTEPLIKKAGLDRLDTLCTASEAVGRGEAVSLSGVCGGIADPLPMLSLFDRQIQLRMVQANVKRWIATLCRS